MTTNEQVLTKEADTDQVDYTGVAERLNGAFEVLIEQADINPALIKLVRGMFTNFMNNADQDALVLILEQLQNELIPYILEGDAGDD
jgi:hypothetical protein